MRNKNIQNLGLKIIALLFAIILWFIVVNIDDPVVSSVYRDIPITVKHEEVISNQGKVYRIKDDVKTVNVTVSAQRSVLSKIKSKDIVAVADLSQMEINTFMVPINASVRGLEGKYQSAEANPRNLQIGIDNVTKNKFPISVNATGTPRDGFIIGEMTANPEKVEIGGGTFCQQYCKSSCKNRCNRFVGKCSCGSGTGVI